MAYLDLSSLDLPDLPGPALRAVPSDTSGAVWVCVRIQKKRWQFWHPPLREEWLHVGGDAGVMMDTDAKLMASIFGAFLLFLVLVAGVVAIAARLLGGLSR